MPNEGTAQIRSLAQPAQALDGHRLSASVSLLLARIRGRLDGGDGRVPGFRFVWFALSQVVVDSASALVSLDG